MDLIWTYAKAIWGASGRTKSLSEGEVIDGERDHRIPEVGPRYAVSRRQKTLLYVY